MILLSARPSQQVFWAAHHLCLLPRPFRAACSFRFAGAAFRATQCFCFVAVAFWGRALFLFVGAAFSGHAMTPHCGCGLSGPCHVFVLSQWPLGPHVNFSIVMALLGHTMTPFVSAAFQGRTMFGFVATSCGAARCFVCCCDPKQPRNNSVLLVWPLGPRDVLLSSERPFRGRLLPLSVITTFFEPHDNPALWARPFGATHYFAF